MGNLTEIVTTYSDEKLNLFSIIKNFFIKCKFKFAIKSALNSIKSEINSRYTSVPQLQNRTQKTDEMNSDLIEEMGNLFNHQNPGSYLMTLKGSNENEKVRLREEKLKELIELLNEKYKIEGFNVSFHYGQSSGCGWYIRTSKTLAINSCYLLVDDEAILNDAVDTVLHEFRHAIQSAIVFDDKFADRLGFDYEVKRVWADNMKHYIRANYDPEGYKSQPIEADANNFAAYIISSYLKEAASEVTV